MYICNKIFNEKYISLRNKNGQEPGIIKKNKSITVNPEFYNCKFSFFN